MSDTVSSDHRMAHLVRDLLTALIRAALLSDPAEGAPYRAEAARLRGELHRDGSADGLRALKTDGLWTLALEAARGPVLDDHALQVAPRLPASSPIDLETLCSDAVSMEALEEKVRLSASTG